MLEGTHKRKSLSQDPVGLLKLHQSGALSSVPYKGFQEPFREILIGLDKMHENEC